MGKVMRKQAGFGLVELMIALILSLIVVGGLYAALIGDQKSYEATRASHLLVGKNRMSIQTLRLYLQQAGFRDYNQLYQNTLLPLVPNADAFGFTWEEGQMVQGMENQNTFPGAKANTDVVSIRFYGAAAPNASIYTCDGSELVADTVTTINFFISTSNQLICRDSGGDTVFDEDMDNLQLLYGSVDDSTFQYYKANAVPNWNEINRVKVGLLVSQEVSMGSLTNTNSYTVLDQVIAASNDRRMRQVVNETILLLNLGS
ncbi:MULTISPECIES: PilW family protein [unclassified Agarivorans]|uniref:PilW family protein n=1 Tax=unclassified Agarivorans TaxID=2636026 RepID=UPI0026E12B80|nr:MULTISPECIES: PilW family protein [unclassified Agarivorans]MDO6687478.1 PilW family protein [Agarivorans sp. 3_MG-2023]MDO6715244.1 PilW family protein [Agarivorans sp. 2_MG-2023]